MFFKIENFDFLLDIKNNLDQIITEFNHAIDVMPELKKFIEIDNKDFFYTSHVYWYALENNILSEQIGTEIRNQSWNAFPLYKTGFQIKWYNQKEIFKYTMPLIEKIPNIYFAAFTKLSPKGSMLPHTHSRNDIVAHFLLNDLDNYCEMICENKSVQLKQKGDYAIFPVNKQHYSVNHSNYTRYNLTVIFENKWQS